MTPGLWFNPEPSRSERERRQRVIQSLGATKPTPDQFESLWQSLEQREAVNNRITVAAAVVAVVGLIAIFKIVKVFFP